MTSALKLTAIFIGTMLLAIACQSWAKHNLRDDCVGCCGE